MFINICVGILAYIIFFFLFSKNEFGLTSLKNVNQAYFLNILFVLFILGYSYYVLTHQSGWSMYVMLGLNVITYFIGFVVDPDEAEKEPEN
mgnify:CR=1 FL=1